MAELSEPETAANAAADASGAEAEASGATAAEAINNAAVDASDAAEASNTADALAVVLRRIPRPSSPGTRKSSARCAAAQVAARRAGRPPGDEAPLRPLRGVRQARVALQPPSGRSPAKSGAAGRRATRCSA